MGCSIETWDAKATSATDGRRLVVRGDGTCPKGGFKLHLEPTNIGIAPEPGTVALRLVVTEPEAGIDRITPAHVKFETHVSGAVNRVRIDIPDGNLWVEVKE